MALTEMCRELNNWFEVKGKDGKPKGRIFGTFTISDGTLEVSGAQDGQYIRICDSAFNDGVYEYPASGLTDETFDGAIWLMNVPAEVVEITKKYDAWLEEYGDVLNSPYQSESFGGYSYSKGATGVSGSTLGTSGGVWSSPFAHELIHWRKI